MTRRKSKQKRSSRGVITLVVLIAVACLAYEPVNRALRTGTDWRTALREWVGSYVPQTQAQTSAYVPPAAKAGTAIEIPAPLTDRQERVLKRMTYTVSYNQKWNLPNWVAWELNADRIVERESRSDKFEPDPDLPQATAVTTDDYKRSGWDRGHMCPAADNRWHWRAMRESFYMTNICPQHHNLNRGDWKELEDACREWTKKYGKLYIVCGPILYKGNRRTIGQAHKVVVPDAFFKVVLTMNPPQAVGFIYKNTSGNKPLDSYVNTVDQVERITGIDFFPALADDVERKVEASYDLKYWPK